MTTEIKAIETTYKGYRFRSRLEARWAVFFEALGIAWQYEAEGFDLGVSGEPGDQVNYGWYLPDFEINHSIFVEIKPSFPVPLPPEEDDRFVDSGTFDAMLQLPRLSALTGKWSLLITGSPWPGDYFAHLFIGDGLRDHIMGLEFGDCRRCEGLGLANDWAQIALICSCDKDSWKGVLYPGGRVMRALSAARAERFDKSS